MYKGYNLKAKLNKSDLFWTYHKDGLKIFQDNLIQLGTTFKSFLEKDGTIDGSKL
jgi:hypothetical protein